MRKVKIVSIGKVKDANIKSMIDEFLKRLRPFCNIEVIELKDEGLIKDSENIKKYMGINSFVMDAKGKQFKSEDFVKLFDDDITFIIGGAKGLIDEVKDKSISLSKMTFPHEMARLMLVEQVYRSFMIKNNKPYHK